MRLLSVLLVCAVVCASAHVTRDIHFNDESTVRDRPAEHHSSLGESVMSGMQNIVHAAKDALFASKGDNVDHASDEAGSRMREGRDAMRDAAFRARTAGHAYSPEERDAIERSRYASDAPDSATASSARKVPSDADYFERNPELARQRDAEFLARHPHLNRDRDAEFVARHPDLAQDTLDRSKDIHYRPTDTILPTKAQEVQDRVASTARDIKDKAYEARDTIADRAADWANRAKDTADTVTDAARAAKNKAADTVYDAADTVTDAARAAKDKAADTMYSAADTVANAARVAKDKAADTMYDAADTVSDAARAAKDTVSDVARAAKDKAADTMHNAADTVSDVARAAKDKAADTMHNAADTIKDTASAAAHKASEYTQAGFEKAKDAAQATAESASSGLRYAARRALQMMENAMRGSWSVVKNSVEGLGDKVSNVIHNTPVYTAGHTWSEDEQKEANLELQVAISLMDKGRRIMDDVSEDCVHSDVKCRTKDEKLQRIREAEHLYQQGIYRVERLLRRSMPEDVSLSLQSGVREARDALYEAQEMIYNISGGAHYNHDPKFSYSNVQPGMGNIDRQFVHERSGRRVDEL